MQGQRKLLDIFASKSIIEWFSIFFFLLIAFKILKVCRVKYIRENPKIPEYPKFRVWIGSGLLILSMGNIRTTFENLLKNRDWTNIKFSGYFGHSIMKWFMKACLKTDLYCNICGNMTRCTFYPKLCLHKKLTPENYYTTWLVFPRMWWHFKSSWHSSRGLSINCVWFWIRASSWNPVIWYQALACLVAFTEIP